VAKCILRNVFDGSPGGESAPRRDPEDDTEDIEEEDDIALPDVYEHRLGYEDVSDAHKGVDGAENGVAK